MELLTLAPSSDRIPVELFQILKDDAVESAALNMQYAGSRHSCFFDDPADFGNLISGSSAFPKANLNIWKFTIHVLLRPELMNFEHYLASM